MSLCIRHLTSGGREVFTVHNKGVSPTSYEIFDNREDIDWRIRHYAPEEPEYCSPDLAKQLGVFEKLYPGFKKDE